MKSTPYSQFCVRRFGNLLSTYTKDQPVEKNMSLVKANISRGYAEYYATALMSVLLGFVGSGILAVLLHVVAPTSYTALLAMSAPPIVALCIGATYLYLPTYRINKRAADIDLFLPYAINFISSMAVAGISPAEIFQTLSMVNVYGELQREAKKIAKDITVMGTDNISALKHAIAISPSRKFKSFLQGIIGTIQSGSDLHVYLANITEKYMDEDLVARKKDLDVLAVIAEVLVISVIAFPIFLVVILTVMGFFGGSMTVSLNILFLFSFLILPLVYALFYLLIKSTSIEKINTIHSEKNITLSQYYEKNKPSLCILFLSAVVVIVCGGVIGVLGLYGYLQVTDYVLLDFSFLSVLILIGPLGIYKSMEVKRKKEIQDRLPEFLVEIGDSLSTGMTVFEAIKVAEKGHYGTLNPEIKKMKAQLSWDTAMKDVFYDFATRMKSAIIQRIVIAIEKGLMMGGNTPKIFKAAAGEVDQVNQIENQRKASMSIYALVILLCFFIFLAIILILNETIFTSFFALQSNQVERLEGIISLSVVDPAMLRYSLFSFVFVQSIGAGLLAGFMMDGKLSSGIRYSCILGIISLFIFKVLF
ncbi:MAG: type II secretion system F family protein [Candidatus Thermoplasmatota archaeon]|nr:type II secretion system F family protein [Candidatus Thermoplasmatota archaeon]